MAELTLFPYQQEHVRVLCGILETSKIAFDLSMLGTGKTYTSAQMATELRLKHIVVIAPVSVKTKWIYMKDTFGIPLTHCISFCELRSTKCKQPKHGLLVRRDYQDQISFMRNRVQVTSNIDRAEFTASTRFKELISEGVLLVIDEIQNIKNNSSQFLACKALMKVIMEDTAGLSRILMVSGSPIDKEIQAVHLFRGMGVMTAPEICKYEIGSRTYDYTGFGQIERYCRAMDPDHRIFTAAYASYSRLFGATMAVKCAYEMFQKILKPRLSHAMDPPKMDVALNKRNGFFIIEREEDVELLRVAVSSLATACQFNAQTNTVNFGGNAAQTLSAISLFMMQIETAKIHTLARLAKQSLASDPNKKVVLCVNYSATIRDLCAQLAEYDPIVLNGPLSVKARTVAIDKFQAPSSQHRVLIANVTVCSCGIDLDDKHGGFPREVFVSPMYNTITLYQLCHRFQRMDTRSSSNIFMVYGKQVSEKNVLSALTKKSAIMKETTENQVLAGVEFPGDYMSYKEGEDSLAQD